MTDVRSNRGRRGKPDGTRGPQTFGWLASALALAILVLQLLLEGGESKALSYLGAVVLVLAVLFIFPPFLLLRQHGHVEAGHTYMDTRYVVDRGVYGVIRHPQYLGYMLLVLGFVLLSQHPITSALGCASIALFYLQASREERYLVSHLGVQYREYCRRVPRFNVIAGSARYVLRRIRSG